MIISSSLLTPEVVVKRNCAVNRGLVLTDCAPVDAQRNNVIMASKRRCFDIVVTLLLCCVCRDAISYNHMKVDNNIKKCMYRISQMFRVVWRQLYCAAKRGPVLTDCAPADAQRIVSLYKASVHSTITLSLRRLTTISDIYIHIHAYNVCTECYKCLRVVNNTCNRVKQAVDK